MKICSKCEIEKDFEEFHLNPQTSDGRDHRCKVCKSVYFRSRYSKNAKSYSLAQFERSLIQKFGITYTEYQAILKDQGEVCLICGRSPSEATRRFAVDHCHKTGKIRGILCSDCNIGLGHFHDDPKVLEAAKAYLIAKFMVSD